MDNPFTERLPGAGVDARRGGEALRRPSVPWGQAAAYVVPAAVALGVMAAAWEVWVRLLDVKVYILPRPSLVLERLFGDIGYFAGHGWTTLWEAMAGFGLGCAVALAGATIMAHSRVLERSLFPLAVLVKVTPIVAVAPLFVIWFGFGSFPKVLIAALITFFPVLVNGLTGLRSVDPGALDFFTSLARVQAGGLLQAEGSKLAPVPVRGLSHLDSSLGYRRGDRRVVYGRPGPWSRDHRGPQQPGHANAVLGGLCAGFHRNLPHDVDILHREAGTVLA